MSNAPVLSFPALPLFLFSLCCVSDEIVSTLGEGTFGRVMECIDHRRWVPRNSRKTAAVFWGSSSQIAVGNTCSPCVNL